MVTGILPKLVSTLGTMVTQTPPPVVVTPAAEEKKPQKDVQTALIHLINALGQLDLSTSQAQQKVVDIITHGDISKDMKEGMMIGLAKMLYNNPKTPEGSKTGIINIFNSVSQSTKAEAFNAGLGAVMLLKDVEPQLYEQYINAYVENAAKDNDIGQEPYIGENFLRLVRVHAIKHPSRAGAALVNITQSWFKRPDKAALWQAAMIVSETDGKTSIKVADKVISDIALKDAVMMLLKMGYEPREDKGNISMWAARQLDPNKIEKSGVDNAVLTNLKLKSSLTHDEFLKTILYPPKKEIAQAVLDGLEKVEISERNKRSIVKLYLKLGKIVRKAAVKQGVSLHKFHKNVLEYLIDKNQEDLRDPSHAFITDKDPVGNEDSPIKQFGITQIGEAEDVFDREGNETSPIKQQCEKTRDILYTEYRTLAHLLKLSLGGNLTAGYFDVSGERFEHSISSGRFGINYGSPQFAEAIRFDGGLYLSTAGSKLTAVGASIGIGVDLADRLYLAAGLNLGWSKVQVIDDDHPAVPFELTEELENGDYEGKTIRPEISLEAFELSLGIGLDILFHGWKIRDGKQIEIGVTAGFDLGFLFGGVTDLDPQRAFNPQGAVIYYNDQNKSYEVLTDPMEIARQGAETSIFFQSLKAMLFIRGVL